MLDVVCAGVITAKNLSKVSDESWNITKHVMLGQIKMED